MRKIFLLCFVICYSTLFGQTNISRALWTGNDKNRFLDLRLANNSTISLFGYASPPTLATQYDDFYLAQTDKLTNVKKSMLLGDSSYEYGRAHLIDKKGDLLLVGTRQPYKNYDQATTIIMKLDTGWDLLWAKTFVLGAYSTDPEFCKQLKDGNYLLGGVTKLAWNDVKAWLCKMDTAGNIIWCKTYTRNACNFNSLEEDMFGNLYVTGYNVAGNTAGTVLKLNSLGNVLWDGSVLGWQYLCGKLGKDGNLYVVGEAYSNGSQHAFMIQRYNGLTGDRVWARKYNNYLGGHLAFDLCFDENGLIYVLGSGTSTDGGTHILKMNVNGTLIKQIKITPSSIIANYNDNQSIQYDTIQHKLWISASGNSTQNYIFMVDTSLINASCLTPTSYPQDTIMSTGTSGGNPSTTVVSTTPIIQSVLVPTRYIQLGSSLSCLNCSPVPISFSYKYIDTVSVGFTNTSDTSNGRSFRWSFGDGNNSVLANPIHIYASKGTFQAKLVSTSSNGLCKDSMIVNVKIEGKPIAKFSASNICFYNNISFTNQSSVSPGTITKSYWFFGNRDTSALLSPSYRYSSPGQYTVKLVVETESGRRDSVQKTIYAHPKPVANYSSSIPCNKDTINFTNSSTISLGKIIYATWTYGTKSFNALNAKIFFPDTGNYTLRMICFSDSACKDTATKTIHVGAKPSVGFTLNNPASQCFQSNIFSFTDITKFAGNNLNALWITPVDTAVGFSLVRSFSPGVVLIKRLAISMDGCRDSVIQKVRVFEQPQLTVIKGDSFPVKNSFKSYTVSKKAKYNYLWQLLGGTLNSGIGTDSISVQWMNLPGAAKLSVSVIDSNGCFSDTSRMNVLVGAFRFELSPDSMQVGYGQTTGNTITIISDTSWVGNTNFSWIHLSPTTGASNNTINLTIDSNTSSSRKGTISFVSNSITRTVTISQLGNSTLGYNEINENRQGIKIYPNPGHDAITISFEGIPMTKEITLIDLFGKIIYKVTTDNISAYSFSAGTLSSGIYILSVESDKKRYHNKLVIGE